jgi:hypothetical protein
MRRGLACLCVVGGLLAAGVARAEAPDKATQAEVRKLQEKRRDLLRDALEGREKLYQKGRAELDGVIEAKALALEAEIGLLKAGGKAKKAEK